MAPLLSRLFNSRKYSNRSCVTRNLLQESQNWKTPVFSSQHQIRVLLFRECDWRGRKLLFDSKTVKKKDIPNKTVSLGANTHQKNEELPSNLSSYQKSTANANTKMDSKNKDSSLKNNLPYEYLKPSPDVKMLGEMLFGSVAMSFWGSTMKIHTIRSPPQLMISFVFPSPMPSNQRLRDFDNSGSLQNSISEHFIPNCSNKLDYSMSSSMAHSVPVDVPGRFNVPSQDLSLYSDSFNSTPPSNSSGTTSVVFSPDSQNSSLTRSSSYNSFQRRWLRNLNTNIEYGLRRRSDELSSLDEPKINGQRRVKLGLSVIFNLGDNPKDENAFREFFFSHIPLIEVHVSKLVDVVSKAYLHKENFVHSVYEGINVLRKSIQDLYMTPRLSNPMWLTMISPSSNHHQQCRKFIGDFLSLIRHHDTKQTHFFVSTLLTTVLTHHLAWVSTVRPTENNPIHNFQRKEAAFWLDQLAKSHPYNPLWMQLGDLYGAVGFPCKVSQTVVFGKKAETILRFLQVLSYFVRCSDVYEKVNEGGVSPEGLKESVPFAQQDSSDSSPFVSGSVAQSVSSSASYENKLRNEQSCLCFGLNNFGNPCCNPNPSNTKQSVMFLVGDCPLSADLDQSRGLDRLTMNDEDTKGNYKDFGSCGGGGADSLGYGSFGNMLDVTDIKETQTTLQEDNTWCTNHDRINLADFVLETVPEVKSESLDEHSSVSNTPTLKIDSSLVPEVSSTVADNFIGSNPDELNRAKLYMQEYRNLRFNSDNNSRESTPVFSASMIESETKGDEEKPTKVNKIDESEVPEEGYLSMDDAQASSNKGLGELIENLLTTVPPATKEFTLPQLQTKDNSNAPSVCSGFGWSLIASLTDHYISDFCLQGVLGNISEEAIFNELSSSVKAPVLGEPISAAICVLADTDTWSVKICSSSGTLFGNRKVSGCMSPLVAGICDSLLQMSQLNMSAELCLMHLEDRLQELFFRSQSLSAILNEEFDSLPQIALEKATSLLSIDPNDLPLLISIASTHSPHLASFNR